ncbi:MAG TPA: adenosylcobinamide-phosphate synthase CbiB [Rhizobiaceae bacterium]|nr:adenosylcobinamide-phosphate synthase CbiB [Rhizobiaceae bacterium]
MSLVLTFLSLLIERAIGYPEPLVQSIGHPVIWIGKLIEFLDQKLNRDTDSQERRRASGIVALVLIVLVSAIVSGALQWVFLFIPFGVVFLAVIASTAFAQRSLTRHVRAVADALDRDGIEGGRRAVSQIVGRDPESLDEAGVARAAIESLAENFSDGIVAPAFWMAIAGLPGGAVYKAVNTADSMIGHRTKRHEAFGWAAARFDDLINLPASRLSAFLIVAAAMIVPDVSHERAWKAIWRDARHHRSPNAGWPEAAMAGALALALAGPRRYGGKLVNDAVMGKGGRREASAADIRRALHLFDTADTLLILLVGIIACIFMLPS